MSHFWQQYDKETLRKHATHCFRKGGGSRPDVLLIEIDGKKAVLKDQSQADKWFSFILGPLLCRRECLALKRLKNTVYTPSILHQPCKRSFLMSYHPSKPITHCELDTEQLARTLTTVREAILQLHQHGVAHNDLRNPTNILLNENHQPILVDLVGVFFQGPRYNLVQRWVFTKFCQVDLSAITKLKQKLAPELLDASDIRSEQIAGKFGLMLRQVGQKLRYLSRKLFTR